MITVFFDQASAVLALSQSCETALSVSFSCCFLSQQYFTHRQTGRARRDEAISSCMRRRLDEQREKEKERMSRETIHDRRGCYRRGMGYKIQRDNFKQTTTNELKNAKQERSCKDCQTITGEDDDARKVMMKSRLVRGERQSAKEQPNRQTKSETERDGAAQSEKDYLLLFLSCSLLFFPFLFLFFLFVSYLSPSGQVLSFSSHWCLPHSVLCALFASL